MRSLIVNVEVDGTWYRPGQAPPPEVAERITNPKAWSDGQPPAPPAAPVAQEPDVVKEPPRGGPGSSADAWRKYADHIGVSYPDGASAKDIAALVDEHKAEG